MRSIIAPVCIIAGFVLFVGGLVYCAAPPQPPNTIRLPDGQVITPPADGSFRMEMEEETDPGFSDRSGSASGRSSSMSTESGEAANSFKVVAPSILGMGWTVDGGSTDIKSSLKSVDPRNALRSWLFIFGAALVAGGLAIMVIPTLLPTLKGGAKYLIIAGTVCCASAFYPGLLLAFGLVGAATAAVPLIRTEIEKVRAREEATRHKELNRATLAVVEMLPEAERNTFKDAASLQFTQEEKDLVKEIKKMDDLPTGRR